jgi:hypothetical protein
MPLRVGLLGADGLGRFQGFHPVPDPGPTDPTDPDDPPPDPEDPPPDPVDPGTLAHGSDVTAANTGFAGLGLTSGSLITTGSITTTGHGQVIYGRKINGIVKVMHDNVSIRGCEINAPIASHGVQTYTGCGGLKVEYTDIHASLTQGGDANGVAGIYHVPNGKPRNLVYRCKIYQVEDGAKLSGGWSFIENRVKIDIKYGSTHNDGVQSQKSTAGFDPSVEILRNWFQLGTNFGNALVFITGESGDQFNVNIDKNLFQAGSATVCVAVHGQDNLHGISGWQGIIRITNNKCVVGWSGGPEGFFSLNTVPPERVVRSGNRRVDTSYVDLGPV